MSLYVINELALALPLGPVHLPRIHTPVVCVLTIPRMVSLTRRSIKLGRCWISLFRYLYSVSFMDYELCSQVRSSLYELRNASDELWLNRTDKNCLPRTELK